MLTKIKNYFHLPVDLLTVVVLHDAREDEGVQRGGTRDPRLLGARGRADGRDLVEDALERGGHGGAGVATVLAGRGETLHQSGDTPDNDENGKMKPKSKPKLK